MCIAAVNMPIQRGNYFHASNTGIAPDIHIVLVICWLFWDNRLTFAFIIKKHDLLPRARVYMALNGIYWSFCYDSYY